MKIKYSFLKIIVAFILGGYSYSQDTNYSHALELINKFEKKLLFSNEDALQISKAIDVITSKYSSKKYAGINIYVKALRLLKIENDIDSAINYAKRAYNNHLSLKDSTFQFRDLNLLYKCYTAKNQRDSSFYYAAKGLELAKLTNNTSNQVQANLDMGDVYYLTRQHDKVKFYRAKALAIAKKNNLQSLRSTAHLKMARVHLILSKQRTQQVLDSAVYHGKRALEAAKKANDAYAIYDSTVVLSDLLNVNKQHQEALRLIETVTGLPKNKQPLSYGYNAPFYHAVILKDNKKYDEAKEITKALLKSTKLKSYSRKKSLYFFLSVLYAHNGQPDSTDYAIKQAIIANNAQSEARLNESIAKLQTQYETKEKEQAITNLEQIEKINQLEIKDLQRQRLVLGVSLLIPVLLLITGGWYMNRRRLKLRLEAEQKGHAAKMSELKALRSQMNPHFIFNAMNSVQSLIIKDKKDEAYNYLTKLSQLIRKTLTSSDKSMVYLDDELDQLVNYLELEKLRFRKDFVYQIDIDENIGQIKIPSMIIQPFVENAVKHGLLHKDGMKHLNIRFELKANLMRCIIEDNGVGRKASKEINRLKPDYQASFSTNAIQKRLELHKHYSNQSIGFEYQDLTEDGRASGTRVTISIPFTTDDN
ncbi:MAG: histidine kinase [Bacteroidota bacterium]